MLACCSAQTVATTADAIPALSNSSVAQALALLSPEGLIIPVDYCVSAAGILSVQLQRLESTSASGVPGQGEEAILAANWQPEAQIVCWA